MWTAQNINNNFIAHSKHSQDTVGNPIFMSEDSAEIYCNIYNSRIDLKDPNCYNKMLMPKWVE